ncbi:hypothetical protein DSO57_1031150 [Entomophthora muscae]|uniref:Uncharacterized protein n=1 Tax=Entomophthora muscae TaxID=34485 RepID=A0ACC2TC84_9FUNG|nr:hypothetical protein DSO57_1031150 [Entomophthora muscae]
MDTNNKNIIIHIGGTQLPGTQQIVKYQGVNHQGVKITTVATVGRSSVGEEKLLSEFQAGSVYTCPCNLERDPLVVNPHSGIFTYCLVDIKLPNLYSVPFILLGEEGFPISQLYLRMDIIPQFLFLVMDQRPRLDLKWCITNYSEVSHEFKDKELTERLEEKLAELLVETGGSDGVDNSYQIYVLDFGLQVFPS